MYRGKQWRNTLGGHKIHLMVLFGIVGRVGQHPREFFDKLEKPGVSLFDEVGVRRK